MTEQLLTEPELTPIVEAFLETQRDYQKALDPIGWSISLEKFYGQPGTETEYAERLGENIERLAERAEQISYALEIGNRFGDFLKMGIDLVAYEYNRELWKYRQQQRDIAEAPLRAWVAAYNARLSAIDSQIKGLKIRRGKLWSKFQNSPMTLAEYDAAYAAISAEIAALEQRREIAAAERFEEQAA